MANLSLTEITRDGKEYRSVLLVEKTFQLNGKTDNFNTDKGLFHAKYLVVGNEKVTRTTDAEDVASKILGLRVKKTNAEKRLVVGGNLAGSTAPLELAITQIEKGEEFGGQPAGGGRVNKGIVFENDLYDRLTEATGGKTVAGKYATETQKIIDMCSAKVGSPVATAKHEGGANQSRPIAVAGNTVYVSPRQHREHGPKLTDITLHHKNGQKSYLSLKYSSTLTFVNSGVAKDIFTETEIRNNNITMPKGRAILKAFGLDELTFCDVFNSYGTGKQHPTGIDVSNAVNRNDLKTFLQTAIGSEYWMIHGMDGDKVYAWYMDPTKNPAMATINTPIIVDYGGAQGRGKRINISFSNQYFDFVVNIRNKQSGLYPSHIMCDYKSKAATGKQLL
jgi:hypothetical protein